MICGNIVWGVAFSADGMLEEWSSCAKSVVSHVYMQQDTCTWSFLFRAGYPQERCSKLQLCWSKVAPAAPEAGADPRTDAITDPANYEVELGTSQTNLIQLRAPPASGQWNIINHIFNIDTNVHCLARCLVWILKWDCKEGGIKGSTLMFCARWPLTHQTNRDHLFQASKNVVDSYVHLRKLSKDNEALNKYHTYRRVRYWASFVKGIHELMVNTPTNPAFQTLSTHPPRGRRVHPRHPGRGDHEEDTTPTKRSPTVPARAAVCQFIMVKQDGTRVQGLIQEKSEARETYDAALAELTNVHPMLYL
ncbi:hypothetical protein CPB85DRAFT_1257376 [Mucidula mucida]|nr:hypothetical protein CPB85DRAFT_1257376 [Mucidula mucida]